MRIAEGWESSSATGKDRSYPSQCVYHLTNVIHRYTSDVNKDATIHEVSSHKKMPFDVDARRTPSPCIHMVTIETQ